MSLFLKDIQEDSRTLQESEKERLVNVYNDYIQHLRNEDALEVLTKLLQNFPLNEDILVCHAFLVNECLDDNKAALESLAVILGEGDKRGISPRHKDALNLRIEINRQEGLFESILTDANSLLALDANNAEVLRYRVEAYYRLGRFDEALQDLNQLLDNTGLFTTLLQRCDLTDMRYFRAHIYYLEHQKTPTPELCQKMQADLGILIGDMPENGQKDYASPEALLLRSDFYEAEGKQQDALSDLNRYLDAHIPSVDVLKRRIAVCKALHDNRQVILDKAAISRLEHQPNSLEEAAALLAYRKRKDQAALHKHLAEDSDLESEDEETYGAKRRRCEDTGAGAPGVQIF